MAYSSSYVLALSGALVLGSTTDALAQVVEEDNDIGWAIGAMATSVLSLGSGPAGIVTAIGTGATLSCDPPPRGWMVAGFVTGGLNAAMSIAWFALAAGAADVSSDPDLLQRRLNLTLPLGAAAGVVATVNFTLSTLTRNKRAANDTQVMLAPMHDGTGGFIPGVQVIGGF